MRDKKFRGGSREQEGKKKQQTLKDSRFGLPSGTGTHVVVTVAVPVVDAEAALVEAADYGRALARAPIGLDRRLRAVSPLRAIRTLTGLAEDELVFGGLGDRRRQLVLRREHLHVFVGQLARRAGDDFDAQQMPARRKRCHVDMRLAVVPRGRVEIAYLVFVRVHLDQLRDRERHATDLLDTPERGVGVLNQLLGLPRVDAHEDILVPRELQGLLDLVVSEAGREETDPVGHLEQRVAEHEASDARVRRGRKRTVHERMTDATGVVVVAVVGTQEVEMVEIDAVIVQHLHRRIDLREWKPEDAVGRECHGDFPLSIGAIVFRL